MATACKNVEININAVVLVLKRRGGTIGDRFVKYSLIPDAMSNTTPTATNVIVSADDPKRQLSAGRKREE
jgi:hypothetical protein